jgi:hypothetical protein
MQHMFLRQTTARQSFWMFGLAVALYALFRFIAGAEFPTPVMDEAYFTPPSLAFAQNFDFHAPSLDPQRSLHWMPVGYPVLAGLWVRLSGMDGLEGVRMFTTLGFLAALVALARVARRLSPAQAWMLFAACLTVPLMGMSSMSRMEPVFWFFAVSMLGALLHQRAGWALALSLVSCLIHPNGVFLCLVACIGAAALAMTEGWSALRSRIKADLPVLVLAVFLCVSYFAYEWRHWADFMVDMEFQLHRKSRSINWRAPLNLGSAVVLCATAAMVIWQGGVVRRSLLLVGAALMLIRLVGQEIFYSPGYMLGLAMVLAAWLPQASEEATAPLVPAQGTRPWGGAWVMPVWAGLLCASFAGSVFVQGWHGSKFSWQDVQARAKVGSDAATAERIVAEALKHLPAAGPRELSCLPWYECMSLWRAADRAGVTVKLYNPVTQPPSADVCVNIDRARPGPTDERGSNWSRGRIVGYQVESCGMRWASGF